MTSIHGRLAVIPLLVAVIHGIGKQQASAQLLNGSLEESVGPVGWMLTQSASGGAVLGDYNGNGAVDAADYVLWRDGGSLQNEVETIGTTTPEDYDAWRARFGSAGGGGGTVSAVEHVDLANHPEGTEGQLGLLIKPFAGNVGANEGQNKAVDVMLTQTYTFGAAAAGRTYTFTGHSYYQVAASNNVDTLFPDSPSGEVPSPTQSFFQIEFLDAGDAVLGTPTRLDLPKNRVTDVLPDDWQMHTVMGLAPAGTTKIRVTAAAQDMVASCTTECPGGQDVYFDNFTLRDSTVPSLERLTNGNLDTPGAPTAWTLEKTAQDNVQFSTADYAIHTGGVGMWLRAFSGGDAKILQTVPGTPGGNYTFGAWSKWELGYSGGDPLSTTQTFLRMEFLDASNAVIGTPAMLDLRTVQMNDDTWREFMLNAVAPAGTAHVRVSVGATGMMNTMINPQSAMFDDFSLMLAGAGNGNLLAAAVPEPTTLVLVAMALVAVSCRRVGPAK
jgi:hypothetical protein